MEQVESMLRDGKLRSISSSGNSTFDISQHQAHVQETLNQMTRTQSELLAAIRSNDKDTTERLQIEYREREKAYKNASMVQNKLHTSLKHKPTCEVAQPNWLPLSKVATTFADRFAQLEDYNPKKHTCYKDLIEFERAKTDSTASTIFKADKTNLIQTTSNPRQEKRRDDEEDIFKTSIFEPQEELTSSITGDPMCQEELKKLFDSLDKSGDGYLSSAELSVMWESKENEFDVPSSNQVLSNLFKYCGGYGNRWKQIGRLSPSTDLPLHITFDEFCTIMLACAAR